MRISSSSSSPSESSIKVRFFSLFLLLLLAEEVVEAADKIVEEVGLTSARRGITPRFAFRRALIAR